MLLDVSSKLDISDSLYSAAE